MTVASLLIFPLVTVRLFVCSRLLTSAHVKRKRETCVILFAIFGTSAQTTKHTSSQEQSDVTKQMMQPVTRFEKRLKKTLSFVPLPILDIVLGASSRLKRSRSERKSRRRSSFKKVQVKQLDPLDPYSPWFRTGKPARTFLTDLESIDSIIWRVLSQNGTKYGLGVRKVTSKEIHNLSDGSVRVNRKYDDKYTWFTYFEIQTRMENMRKGLLSLGVKKDDRVTIFMEASIERKIVIASIMRIGAVPSLVPADRRLLASHYMINQLESSVMLVTADTVTRIPALAPHLTHTRRVIVAQEEVGCVLEVLPFGRTGLKNFYEEPIDIMTFKEVEELGQRMPDTPSYESHPDDAAFIVFTSGSTGTNITLIWDELF